MSEQVSHSRRDFLKETTRATALIVSGALIYAAADKLGIGDPSARQVAALPTSTPEFTATPGLVVSTREARPSATATSTPEAPRPTATLAASNQSIRDIPGWHMTKLPFYVDPEWDPMDAALAKKLGMITLHDLNGPLAVYDAIATKITGVKSHARQAAEDIARDELRNFPENRGWAGYCAARKRAGILYKKPKTNTPEYKDTKTAVDVAAKKGILTMVASGRPVVEISKAELLHQYTDPSVQNRLYVARMSDNYFRIVIGVNDAGTMIYADDFGKNPLAFDLRQVVSLWLPSIYHGTVNQAVARRAMIMKNPDLDEKLALEIANS